MLMLRRKGDAGRTSMAEEDEGRYLPIRAKEEIGSPCLEHEKFR